jgi:hypothetical protein
MSLLFIVPTGWWPQSSSGTQVYLPAIIAWTLARYDRKGDIADD